MNLENSLLLSLLEEHFWRVSMLAVSAIFFFFFFFFVFFFFFFFLGFFFFFFKKTKKFSIFFTGGIAFLGGLYVSSFGNFFFFFFFLDVVSVWDGFGLFFVRSYSTKLVPLFWQTVRPGAERRGHEL